MNETESIIIREITPQDNKAIARIIRKTLEEYNSAITGTAYFDESLDDMYTAYQKEGTIYFVAEMNGKPVGGAGIGKLSGLGNEYCELQKMYILPEARGRGVGRKLMEYCLDFAQRFSYKKCYLESFSYMHKALKLYTQTGFVLLDAPKGTTSHTACDVWMELPLD